MKRQAEAKRHDRRDRLGCRSIPAHSNNNMGKSGSSHFRDPPLISEESPLKSEAVLIKYLDFWDC